MIPGNEELRNSLIRRIKASREASDSLFGMLSPDALTSRPIPARHRIIFYLGHLEAFEWNLLARTTMGLDPFNEPFDQLFALGIDPVDGGLPSDIPSDWPSVSEIMAYNQRVRNTVDGLLKQVDFDESEDLHQGLVFEVAIEHRMMHAETLAYMLHGVPVESKQTPANAKSRVPDRDTRPESVDIPEGVATLGQQRGDGFGWDNEFGEVLDAAAAFRIDRFNVTNGQYLEFIRAGGYQDSAFWNQNDWKWIEQEGVRHPHYWNRDRSTHKEVWMLGDMFGIRPLPLSWPVYVSHAEAAAYALWKGHTLPTEAQLHRATYGTPEGTERHFPWGPEPPDPERGNFNGYQWNPTPVGAYPDGDSAFGVADLVGNGWEWTSTPFEPLHGFERFHFYPGYSADFFDGKHYVMKGGSARTAASMLRRSFRNWFQPHYPYTYSSFRLVEA
jgi:iron(II)-dependent oxidoreductase